MLFCCGLVVAANKLYWWVYAGVPIGHSADIWDQYYPEIRLLVPKPPPRHRDQRFDVLLLGASVLDPGWGSVQAELEQRLRKELGERFQVVNLARPGQTSRDSLIKYAHLEQAEFELVIVYNGINDVRLNNHPRDKFREDYTHIAWYRGFQEQLATGSPKFPRELLKELALTMPLGNYEQKNIEEGREFTTVPAIRANLAGIADVAARRGDRVLLMTFAYDIPAEYDRERFAHGEYAYGKGISTPLGAHSWGKAEYVAAGVDAQNEAIRQLARTRDNVLFVDQQAEMPQQEYLFFDCCHLTAEGSARFVENLWPTVSARVAEWRAAQ